jgi:hypothetical protein
MRPLKEKELEVFVDASFCGDWDPAEAARDRDTARSRHGYIINCAGCPLLWKSQLQTEIALSSTESEYTGLSYALRDTIPIMQLLKEMKVNGFPINAPQARVHCQVFEDNSGALEMAKVHKYRPRTKHLNVRLHHFRDYVERKEISIHHISTNDQPADFLTNYLTRRHFYDIRKLNSDGELTPPLGRERECDNAEILYCSLNVRIPNGNKRSLHDYVRTRILRTQSRSSQVMQS